MRVEAYWSGLDAPALGHMITSHLGDVVGFVVEVRDPAAVGQGLECAGVSGQQGEPEGTLLVLELAGYRAVSCIF